jgi:SAM-dependent methyltransferase
MDLENELIESDEKKDFNKVYWVKNGEKRWIMHPGIFEKLGFKWENIKKIPQSIIDTILEGLPIGESVRDNRYRMAEPFLSGRGIEIGAGMNPQRLPEGVVCEYFDKRNDEEFLKYFAENSKIKTYPMTEFSLYFADLSDFLIAHNVLEHCSNPISTLIGWHNLVKHGGTVIISVPYHECCPDKGRNVSPFDHILLDYLLERNDDSFESREHIYSNIMGWIDDGGFKGKSKLEVAQSAHQCAKAEVNDLHWHVFSEDVLKMIIMFSALITGKNIIFERVAAPYKTDIVEKTDCEIIMVYRIYNEIPQSIDGVLKQELEKTRHLLNAAQVRIGNNLDNK